MHGDRNGHAAPGLSQNSAATVIGAMIIAPLGFLSVALGAAVVPPTDASQAPWSEYLGGSSVIWLMCHLLMAEPELPTSMAHILRC